VYRLLECLGKKGNRRESQQLSTNQAPWIIMIILPYYYFIFICQGIPSKNYVSLVTPNCRVTLQLDTLVVALCRMRQRKRRVNTAISFIWAISMPSQTHTAICLALSAQSYTPDRLHAGAPRHPTYSKLPDSNAKIIDQDNPL